MGGDGRGRGREGKGRGGDGDGKGGDLSCAVLTFPLKNLKECDILEGAGSKHTLIPLTYFPGVRTLNPQDICPWLD